jgi:hypothetical protein
MGDVMRWGWLAVVAAMSLPTTVQALPDRNIGVVGATSVRPGMATADVPVQRFAGKTFVFLEKAPCDRGMGYPGFQTLSPAAAHDGGLQVGLDYESYVGKELRAESVESLACPAGEFVVRFTVVADGTPVQAQTTGQAVADIAAVDDMTWARQRWLGLIVFPRKRAIDTYDAASGRYGRLEVRMNEPLRVVDVIWGMSAVKPLWLIVQRDTGEQGFIATAYSWTNLYSDWWTALRPWENLIAESNIRYDSKQQNPMGNPRDAWLGGRRAIN